MLTRGTSYVWDDTYLIVDNPLFGPEGDLWTALSGPMWQTNGEFAADYYRPLVTLSLWLDVSVFRLTPDGQHVENFLLHLLCIVLVARWLSRRVPVGHAHASPWWLAAATLIFAIHPSRPESVAWISGRGDLLMLVFFLLGDEAASQRARAPARSLALTSLCFALAIASKEITAFVLIAWFADRLLRSPTTDSSDGAASPPEASFLTAERRFALAAIVVAGLVFLVRLWVFPPTGRTYASSPWTPLWALGLFVRETLASGTPSIVIAPSVFDEAGVRIIDYPMAALGLATTVAFLTLIVVAARDRRARPYLADALFVIVPLLPVVQIIVLATSGLVAERYLHVPHLGVAALVLRGAGALESRLHHPRGIAIGATLALGMAFMPAAYAYSAAFRGNRALWEYEYALDPNRTYVTAQLEEALPNNVNYDSQRLALSARALRLAARDRQWAMVARRTFGEIVREASATPPGLCPEEARRKAFAFANGESIRVGTPPVEVQLPAHQLTIMREHYQDAHLMLAQLSLQCGAYQAAREVVEQGSGGASTEAFVAHLDAIEGHYDRARRTLQSLIERYPAVRSHREALAAVDSAAEFSERAEQDPAHAALYQARARWLLGDWVGARRTLSPAGTPIDNRPETLGAIVQLETFAQNYPAAYEALRLAELEHPGLAPRWAALRVALEEASARSTGAM